MVIMTTNPVHSVLYLITVFTSAAGFLILWGQEYLGLTLLIVYVGAIAILFLFIVMMLNITIAEQATPRVLPIGILLGLVLLYEIIMAFKLPLTEIDQEPI